MKGQVEEEAHDRGKGRAADLPSQLDDEARCLEDCRGHRSGGLSENPSPPRLGFGRVGQGRNRRSLREFCY